MLLEKRIETPFVIRGNYDAGTTYSVGDVVRATVSSVSQAWVLMVDAPAGTAPRANSAYWATLTAALATNQGAQGLPAPAAQVQYSATDSPNYTWRDAYVDNDNFRRVSYDAGTTWVIERIRGAVGPQGDTPTVRDGVDGQNAPLVTWQYAADPPDDQTPLEWRDTYVRGDVWKHWSNDGGNTYGVPERILARDGRDGFDLELQYSDSADGPWEVHDTGQHWVRSRVGDLDPFGPPINRTGEAHATSEVTEAQVRTLAAAAARARYTDDEKTKLAGIESNATQDQTPEEIRDALRSLGIAFEQEIVDMLDGLRDATADDFGKIGIGPDGILYRVKRTANPGHDAEGMFGEYMHAQFRGVAHGRPSNPQVGEIYYNIRIHQWYLFFENRVVVMIDTQPITPIQALGANTEWIGEVDNQYQALHAIQNFDNTKAYYAVYNETLYVLDNSTYSAATTETTYSYAWVPAIPEIAPDDDKVSKEDLDPIVRVYPESRRTTELMGIYQFRIYNLDAVSPDVDAIEVFFDNERVFGRAIDSTFEHSILRVTDEVAATISGRSPPFDGSWTLRFVFSKDSEVQHTVNVPVYYVVGDPDSVAIAKNARDIDTLQDKTADMFVHRTPGNFANNNNSQVAGIAIVLKNAANQQALNSGTFDFSTTPFDTTSAGVAADDTHVYDLVVRTAKSLGRVEGEFRVYDRTVGTEFALPLRQLIQEDENWYYYFTTDVRAGAQWNLQYRGTHPHNTYNGELGDHPLSQINAQLPDRPGTSTGGGVLAYDSIAVNTSIQARQIVVYQNGYYGCITTHSKEIGDNPASDTARWRYLSSVIGNWVAGDYPAGTIAKAGNEQWIANEAILAADPSPTHENNTKWKRLTSHEGLTALITRVDDAFDDINTNRLKIAEDETKLENFIQTVNNYFNGQGEGDVTAQEIAHLFALLDEYNPVIDEIRSTLGLVSETQPAQRLIQAFEDQTTLISNANPPATLPKLQHRILDLADDNPMIYVSGENTIFSVRTYNSIIAHADTPANDPYLEYYLGGDSDAADALKISAFTFADNKIFIAFPLAPTTGADPLAAITSASLRPYAVYQPIDTIPANPANTTYETTMTLAPTNANHDVSFIPSFNTEIPDSQMQIASRDSRGWYFNDIASDTPNTLCKIFARWYQDVAWVWRIYGYYSQLVRARELSSWIPEANDPRLHTWSDPTKDYNDVGAVVDRPPYPSLDALKAAIPLPTLRLYFKPSASGLVMKTAVHDIHHPVRSKLVQIPDTHYNTPPRVTQLPMVARENEVFQLVSDQYRPDSDHTWTFEPGKVTVNNRTVVGAASANVIASGQARFGRISATQNTELPIVFQAAAVRAIIAYSDDPEHFYFYIHNSRVSTSDVITIEMHGERSDGSPIIKTGTFRYSRASGDDRVFQARVSGAYGALDLSDKFSISIKRGNTYLYMNTANIPPTGEWETGLLNTAGLYKGKADGSFVRSVILEETELAAITGRFGGRELLTKTGSFPYRVIANANATLSDAIATNDTRFSDAGLFANQQNTSDDKHLSQFDRLLFEVYLLNASNVAVASTSFQMSYLQFAAIVAQGTANVSATNQVDATVEDGRAVIHNWRTKDKPLTPVDSNRSLGQKAYTNAVQDAIHDWIDAFRAVDHTIYIGRTGETNSRMLIAVKSHKLGIGLQVRGYH